MAKKIRALIVDDDSEFHELIEYNLRTSGFEVLKALDGREGLEIVGKEDIDVILLDTTMPGMDGLEVLSELKHNPKTEKIPVIMLTGKTMVGDIERAFEVGADDYITKPVRVIELGKIIKSKLQKLRQDNPSS